MGELHHAVLEKAEFLQVVSERFDIYSIDLRVTLPICCCMKLVCKKQKRGSLRCL